MTKSPLFILNEGHEVFMFITLKYLKTLSKNSMKDFAGILPRQNSKCTHTKFRSGIHRPKPGLKIFWKSWTGPELSSLCKNLGLGPTKMSSLPPTKF